MNQPISSDNPDGEETPETPGNDDSNNDDENPMNNNLKITVGSVSFSAILEDNVTTRVFKKLLPMTVNMSELNGNEKYYYLSGNLPTAFYNPGTIRTGDLMLYGSSRMLLFYETFSTSYSYTRLGRVDNPSGLAAVLGSGSITVIFELQ
uniref:cyclophilin-like fold protein n=1 Tax=Bacteroides cellulosilyticus TaxID=246787 RepID=UPI00402500AC